MVSDIGLINKAQTSIATVCLATFVITFCWHFLYAYNETINLALLDYAQLRLTYCRRIKCTVTFALLFYKRCSLNINKAIRQPLQNKEQTI